MASSSESHGTHDLNAATNPMTLNKKGLDAAHAAYAKTTGGLLEGHPMANAITAYLAALPTPDGLVERLETMAKWLDDGLGHEILSPKPLREAATFIQTLQRSVHELEERVSALEEERQNLIATKREQITRLTSIAEAAEQQVRDMRDENARMREALTRIAEMDGTAGTEKGPPCEWTKNGVTTIRPSGIGNFANHIARLALKNQESDREV